MKWLYILVLCGVAFAHSPEENINNPTLFEGDMILTTEQRRLVGLGSGRAATKNKKKLWPKGELFYVIDRSLVKQSAARKAIEQAINEYKKKTCIRLKKRTNQRDYVNFRSRKDFGCSSFVGKRGGKQDINLERGCWNKGIVVHEIGHALGFYHEQSRPDRDKFVTILFKNIIEINLHGCWPRFKFAFRKLSPNVINTLGFRYDYGSVMHYGPRFFSKNGKPTIVPKRKGVTIGQRNGLSGIDAKQMNALYKSQCKKRLLITKV